jgi:hypothetical protein
VNGATPGQAQAVDAVVMEWLDRRTATALATAPGIDDREEGKRQGIEQLRYTHLDDYSYTLTPAILDALAAQEPVLAVVDLHRWYAVITQPDGTSKVIGHTDDGLGYYEFGDDSDRAFATWDELPAIRRKRMETAAAAVETGQLRLAREDCDAVRKAVLDLAAEFGDATENDEIEGYTPGSLYMAIRAEILNAAAAKIRKGLDL